MTTKIYNSENVLIYTELNYCKTFIAVETKASKTG